MVTIYDVDPSELILKAADKLKSFETIKAPSWALYVKTGASKERPPLNKDWWHMRVASILRKVCVLGPIGVNKLRVKYGGKKNRGHKPEHFYPGSGNIIRKALQQLEKAGLIIQVEKGVHKGKAITPKGTKFLDSVANEITGKKPEKTGKIIDDYKKDLEKDDKKSEEEE